MGAQLAFELTRELQLAGLPLPGHVFISARRPPQAEDPVPGVERQPDSELLAHLRRLGGVPEELLEHAGARASILAGLRSDLLLLASAADRSGPPLATALTALGGREDPVVEGEVLEGWRTHARTFHGVHLFPGGHFYFQEQAREVWARIEATLQPQRQALLAAAS